MDWLLVPDAGYICPFGIYVPGKTKQAFEYIFRMIILKSEQLGHLTFDVSPKAIKNLGEKSVQRSF
jgi:hypothetical protein